MGSRLRPHSSINPYLRNPRALEHRFARHWHARCGWFGAQEVGLGYAGRWCSFSAALGFTEPCFMGSLATAKLSSLPRSCQSATCPERDFSWFTLRPYIWASDQNSSAHSSEQNLPVAVQIIGEVTARNVAFLAPNVVAERASKEALKCAREQK